MASEEDEKKMELEHVTSLSRRDHERPNPFFRVRAVSLGGWLVTEGWIKPSLFDGIPNKDLLDGTSLRFKSVSTGKYLCAKSGGGNVLLANGTGASTAWETITLWRINEDTFRLRVFNKQFVGLDGINVVAVSDTPIHSDTFRIVKESDSSSRVRIKAPNGHFMQAKTEELVIADVSNANGWGDDDPTIFEMTIVATLQGEFQLTNGYGPNKAPEIMKEHWNTFIVEDDFKFMKSHGLDAARIPVGWWIASDPYPPPPYVGGSLHALDNAFKWAQYAKNPSLYAVELLNEPLFPNVTLESLTKYYNDAYNAVRRHSSTAYVVLSNRLDLSSQLEIPNTKELFPLATGLRRCVIDVHYYNLYYDIFEDMNAQENIDFIYKVRSSQLDNITTVDGPLTFVGEWTAEWKVEGATKKDYQRFVKAELDVFGRATFGWCYWTLKNRAGEREETLSALSSLSFDGDERCKAEEGRDPEAGEGDRFAPASNGGAA
ncbi:hypothetical protein JHK85_041084 [Glycine max]|nr:hypothetical protein JHK85_041084 [Glycine max]